MKIHGGSTLARNATTSWVYVIRYDRMTSRDDGILSSDSEHPHKIGMTDNVDGRIRVLQTGYPFLIYPVSLVRGGQVRESELHAQYEHRRISGEWFWLSEQDVDRINQSMTADDRELLRYVLDRSFRRMEERRGPSYDEDDDDEDD